MKNFFAIISISLLAFSSFAGVGSWQISNEQHFVAPDNESFMALQAQFPEHFGDVDGTSVTNATLDLFDFYFVGPTQCPANDPRLYAHTYSKSMCFDFGTHCTAMTSPMPAPIDPCL